MKENTCNYSDDFQPYIDDYDKFEYDIKLKDGTIVFNCYPNAGKFNSFRDDSSHLEEAISEIRFSNDPTTYLNSEVSRFTPILDEPIVIKMLPSPFNSRVSVPQYRREEPKIGRNAPCFCGSGKKYKNCCVK